VKKITFEQKLEIIELASKLGISKTANIYNISRTAISKWKRKVKELGEESLKPKKRIKFKHPDSMDDETIEKIIQLKKTNPNYSTQKIKDVLNLKYSKVTISKKLNKHYFKNKKTVPIVDKNEVLPFSKLFLTIKSIDETILKEYTKDVPMFRIILEDKITGLSFMGLSFDKTELSIGIFADYIFNILQKTDLISEETTLYTNTKSTIIKDSILKAVANKYLIKLHLNEKYKLVKAKEFLSEQWIHSNKEVADSSKQINIALQRDLYSYEIIRNTDSLFRKFKNMSNEMILKKYGRRFYDLIYNSFPIIVNDHIKSIYNLSNNENYWNNVSLNNRKELDRIIISIKNIAFNKKKLSQLKESIELYDKILFSFDYTDNIELKIKVLKERANTLLQAGKWEGVAENLKTAFSLAKKNDDSFNIADLSRLLGQINLQKSNFEESLINFKKYIKYAKEIDNSEMLSIGYLNLGNLYFRLEKLDLSSKYFNMVLELYPYTQNNYHKMIATSDIGLIYISKNKYQKALKYLEETYSLALECKDTQEEMRALGNLGIVNYTLGKIEKSEKICNILYDSSVKLGNKLWISAALNNMFQIYIVKRDYKQAFDSCSKLLDNAKKIKNNYQIITAYNNYAEIYLKLKNKENALKSINFALKISRKIDSSVFYLDSLKRKIEIYYYNKKFSKVDFWLKKARLELDSTNIKELENSYHILELKNSLSQILTNKEMDSEIFKKMFDQLFFIIQKKEKKRNKFFSEYDYLIINYFDLFLILLELKEQNNIRKKYFKIIKEKLKKHLRKVENITGIKPNENMLELINK